MVIPEKNDSRQSRVSWVEPVQKPSKEVKRT